MGSTSPSTRRTPLGYLMSNIVQEPCSNPGLPTSHHLSTALPQVTAFSSLLNVVSVLSRTETVSRSLPFPPLPRCQFVHHVPPSCPDYTSDRTLKDAYTSVVLNENTWQVEFTVHSVHPLLTHRGSQRKLRVPVRDFQSSICCAGHLGTSTCMFV